jgi:hypothetical protein
VKDNQDNENVCCESELNSQFLEIFIPRQRLGIDYAAERCGDLNEED